MSGFKYEKRPDPHGQDTSHSSWTSSKQGPNAEVPNQGYRPAQPAQPARKFTPSEQQQLKKEIHERETYERQIKEARLRFNARNPNISPDTIVYPGDELREIQAEEAALKAQGDKKLIAQSIEFRDGYPHFDFKVPKSVQHAGGTVSSIAIKRAFRKILIHRLTELGVKEAAALPADEVGIGVFIQLGLAAHSAWSLYEDWDEMWKEAATETSAPTQTQIPNKSNSANPPAKQSVQVQPVNLGDVPVYGAPISISSDFGKQQADFDRAYAQRHAQEEKQARTEQGRSDQRRSVNEFHNSKLWKVAYQDNLRSYLSWLAIHDPKWLDKMKGQANRAYGTMTDYGKDFSFNRVALTDTPEQLQKHIQALTMYRSDIRARELVEYSNLELNLSSIVGKEFNHQKLLSVRHNFDAVFAGKYGKTIAPDKVRLIESEADRVYRQETGTDKVDRSSALWKVLRNVQAVSIFRDLWATVQQPPAGIMTNPNDPSLGANALNRSGQGLTLKVPTSTAHPQQPDKISPNDINKPGTAPAIDVKNHTGHPKVQDDLIKYRFEQRLPRSKGSWTGQAGESNWHSDDARVNKVTQGKPIPFHNGYPDFSEWSRASVTSPSLTGENNEDFATADKIYAEQQGWLHNGQPNAAESARYRQLHRLTWHHVEDGKTLQLVPRDLNNLVPHEGGASIIRNGERNE